jgi:hypothetical protein
MVFLRFGSKFRLIRGTHEIKPESWIYGHVTQVTDNGLQYVYDILLRFPYGEAVASIKSDYIYPLEEISEEEFLTSQLLQS